MTAKKKKSFTGGLARLRPAPHTLSWLLVLSSVYLLSRLICIPLIMLPQCAAFNPLAFLPALFILQFGIPGTLAACLCTGLADVMTGCGNGLTLFRIAGLIAGSCFFFTIFPGPPQTDPKQTTKGLAAWIIGINFIMLTEYAYTGYGSEVLRFYPFPYITAILSLPALILIPLLGFPLYRWLHASLPEHAGQPLYPRLYPTSRMRRFLLLISPPVMILCGDIIASRVYHIRPASPFIIGVTNCPAVHYSVLALLAAQWLLWLAPLLFFAIKKGLKKVPVIGTFF